ncbi:cytochrome P450 [Suillus ampliporus]|nr:cytochrome P450 [Suillus ampliporus]
MRCDVDRYGVDGYTPCYTIGPTREQHGSVRVSINICIFVSPNLGSDLRCKKWLEAVAHPYEFAKSPSSLWEYLTCGKGAGVVTISKLDSMALTIIACAFLLASLWVVKQWYRAAARRLPLPPGPPGRWLLGNKIPESYAPFQYAKWTEEYGPVFSLRQGPRIFVVIGRHQAAVDIMEKEGVALADRPRSIAAHETLSDGLTILLMGSGERLRRLRRILHGGLQPKATETYAPMQIRNAKIMVLDILNDPKNHQMHAMGFAASVILKSSPSISLLRVLGGVVKPGAYLVDTYPILRFVPGYLSQLKAWHQEEFAFFDGQLDVVRRQIREGTAEPSFAKFILEHQKEYELEHKELAYLAGGMFGAGVDTTSSAITIMIMAAAIHTDAQARVQEELDNVVGRARCFAHRATKDIIWKNYLIPAGATVIGNTWAIANDPEVFPEPHKFNPQRWIDETGRVRDGLKSFAFGFGRRVCPGQHLANRSVFINTALILWAFRLSENPVAKIDTFAFSDTPSTHAAPFEICVEKRVDERVIREMCAP